MSRSTVLNPHATAAFAQTLKPDDRILILGASGWFGRTALAALAALGQHSENLLMVGSLAREINVSGRTYHLQEWDPSAVDRFQPTVVFDFAFLTRDWLKTLGEAEYIRRNKELTSRLFEVLAIGSLRRLLTVSSGASLKPQMDGESRGLDPYGQQKKETELRLREVAAMGAVDVIIARAWSVSGGFVQKPSNYAFSDFIMSSINRGVIEVRADHLVLRRYCSVEDLIAVALLDSSGRPFYELDSGGSLIELVDLAKIISEAAGGVRVEVRYENRLAKPGDSYHSSGAAWDSALQRTRYQALTLRQQIRNVANALARP